MTGTESAVVIHHLLGPVAMCLSTQFKLEIRISDWGWEGRKKNRRCILPQCPFTKHLWNFASKLVRICPSFATHGLSMIFTHRVGILSF